MDLQSGLNQKHLHLSTQYSRIGALANAIPRLDSGAANAVLTDLRNRRLVADVDPQDEVALIYVVAENSTLPRVRTH